ncbi:pyridoxal phosphate-dependent aminotransferase [Candidatus Magnetaquicoccus inordinatus]|uniref:pyridoxal phosphate-dependent aminotransferase n=1 Tax=Candidatus Magnetaquicoccus inordinatus TaxID=2496818 RepID=UPI00102B27F7|nr:pyridoxal phosphate-dependent aminotransferase [Candidatus Magnetaquicoccus inordinatus]
MALLSNRIQKVKPSPTLAIAAKAKELQAQGIDVIDLGSGEPDFDTPKHIKKAAIRALKEGFTKYTAVDGIPELKKAIIGKFARDNQLSFEPNQIVVTVGGKQAFYNLAQAMLNPGDEVIIPVPYWVSYPDMVLLADGVPVFVPSQEETGFKITPQALEAAITPKTRFVVINSPSNPSGAAYSAEELQQLGAVIERHPHVWAVVDDIYDKLVYDGFTAVTLTQVVPALKERTVIVHGVSKTYSMTGWRIGYAAGPSEIIKAMGKMQSQSTSNATSIAQRAAVAALDGPQKVIKPMLKAFAQRRNFVVESLNAIPGIRCRAPEGSFYVFPNVGGLIGSKSPDGTVMQSSMELAAFMLNTHQIALVPGLAFGMDPYVRISFATSMENLQKAMERMRLVSKDLLG